MTGYKKKLALKGVRKKGSRKKLENLKVVINIDRKPRNEEELRKRKLDGNIARGDTGCKKNERKILCPRARNISQDCLYLSRYL